MDLAQRKKILQPYLDKLNKANQIVKDLEGDPAYLAHLAKIKEAEREANQAMSDLDEIFRSL